MPYTCMFTVLTDDAFVEEALDHATALAQSSVQGRDAHLEVLCLGVDRSQTGYYYAGASPALLEQTIASAKADAEAIEAKVRERLDGLPMTWSCDTGVAQLADVARHVAARARFNDLAILPRPYGKGRGVDMEAATEAVLFEAGVPVFTAPPGSDPALTPKRVVVGWNESPEALSAVRAALPILRAADKVHLAVIDPPDPRPQPLRSRGPTVAISCAPRREGGNRRAFAHPAPRVGGAATAHGRRWGRIAGDGGLWPFALSRGDFRRRHARLAGRRDRSAFPRALTPQPCGKSKAPRVRAGAFVGEGKRGV
jgi:hypothetical protein